MQSHPSMEHALPLHAGWIFSYLFLLTGTVWGAPPEIDFNRDIRPILSEYCYACHGPNSDSSQSELRLADRVALVASHVIVPGRSNESELIERVSREDADGKMPPPDSGKVLPSKAIEKLKQWIDEGAPYDVHWSFRKIAPPSNPDPRAGIDDPLERTCRSQELQLANRATPSILLRRLSLDLTGLPPTFEEVQAFQAEPSSDAYARWVEEYLSRPQFGERMAMDWLDAVRYADTIGYHSDNPRNVWPYRDWVVQAFNENLPFDRFTLYQIAGDLIPDANSQSRIASAFNRLVQSTEEGGAQPKDYEFRMMSDRVRAVGTAWLGLTLGCAQCHDHKFDPISSKDFYSLGAYFADIDEKSIGAREEGMLVVTSDQQLELDRLEKDYETAQETLKANAQNPSESMMAAVEATRTAHKRFLEKLPKCLVSRQRLPPRIVRFHPRGNWMDETGPILSPLPPSCLIASDAEPIGSDRVSLARWLTSTDNSLVARVQVNRCWAHFFGEGLSRHLDDLGSQGEVPPQLEVLDWLAWDWMESGWDFKHLVRRIVLSDAYQRSSQSDELTRARDPENRFFSHQNAVRLPAEVLRDQSLWDARLLSIELGGPPVKPYQPDGYWENLNFPIRKYVADAGDRQYRRGLYVWWQRSFLHPSLLALDAPSREEACVERFRSNTPQQALTLLNDPCFVEAYRAIGERWAAMTPDDDAERIQKMFGSILLRPASETEIATLEELLMRHRTWYRDHPEDAKKLLRVGQKPDSEGDPAEMASWSHVARVLLNTHEAITRF